MKKKADEFCLPPEEEAVWLVYTHGDQNEYEELQTFCKIEGYNSSRYIKSIPQLRSKSIRAFCRGWLILRSFIDKRVYSLWNPLTFQSVSIPRLPHEFDPDLIQVDEVCTLITDLSHNVCVVLLFFGDQVLSYRTTGCRWVRHRVELDGESLDVCDVIAVNNTIYGWATTERLYLSCLFSMEVADDNFHSLTIKSLQMDRPQSGIGCLQSVEYWVESCGHIYYVCVYIRHNRDHRISMVKVLELDLAGRNWMEVKSLDGRAFFLGKDCSTWCWGSNTTTSNNNNSNSFKSSSTGGGDSGCVRGDCVYFIFPERGDAVYYCYSLDEGNLSVFESCPNLQSPFNSPTWLNMMPQHHRLLGVLDAKGQECNQIKENVDDEGLDHGMINCSINYNECLAQQKETQGESPRFFELPQHLINLISKYMHLFDFWNFRASCKTFQSAVPLEPCCRTNNMLPLFVYLKNDGRSCEILDPSRDDSCPSTFQLSSDPFAIDFFKDGWLVISVGPERLLKYFNPFTRVRGDFPTDVGISCFSSIGFSTYPTSPDCLTVAIVDKHVAIEINYVKYGDECWDSFEFSYEDVDLNFRPGTSSPIFYAGTLYILDRIGYLGAFALVNGEKSWRVFDRPQTQYSDLDSSHLVKSGGQLHAVFIGYMGKWIEVFKFNLLTENWSKVRSLGNHSFFISHTSSFSVETTEVWNLWMRNRIYLSRLKGNGILFYSLETGKYHVFGSEESMENFYGTKEPMHCWL